MLKPHYSDAKSPVVILTKLFDWFIILFFDVLQAIWLHIILYTSKTVGSLHSAVALFDYHVILNGSKPINGKRYAMQSLITM